MHLAVKDHRRKYCHLYGVIRSDFFAETDNISHLNTIGSYFRELTSHCELLDSKYHHENAAFRNLECFVNTRPMVAKLLIKIHKRIMSRLKETPSTCNPWNGYFSIDVSSEVFDILLDKIIKKNGFGHEIKESQAYIHIDVTDICKVIYIYILNRQNIDGELVAKGSIGCKEEGEFKTTKLVVSNTKPFIIRYHKTTETLTVSFHYGHCNDSGLPQH